jgi:putative addiction module killer protein
MFSVKISLCLSQNHSVDKQQSVNYSSHMVEIFRTAEFNKWLFGLSDTVSASRIQARIDRLGIGLFGDVKPVGNGVSELRVNYGPGYRIYFIQRGNKLIILLCGGDKSSQDRDISKAKAIAKEMSNDN